MPTIDDYNRVTDDLDEQIRALSAKKREASEARFTLAQAEHAAYYGLTPEEYAEVKARAKHEAEQADDVSEERRGEAYRFAFQKALGKARKARAVQVAQAAVARAGAQAKGV